MDDDDDFLYGEEAAGRRAAATVPVQADAGTPQHKSMSQVPTSEDTDPAANAVSEDEEQAMDEEDGSESDLEIITDRIPMTLDNRGGAKSAAPVAPPLQDAASTTSSSFTTEYTPQKRVSSASLVPASPPSQTPPIAHQTTDPLFPTNLATNAEESKPPLVDTSKLPVATAPTSYPTIDPTVPGMHDNRPIFEVDMDSLGDKPWRRPGSIISDWFNYGFDEISWEAYCYRRRQLGEDANVLRANVLNFSGLMEDQIVSLPPEARSMVMTGTTTMMNNQQQAGMMTGHNMGMNAMIGDMSGMQMPMGMVGMQNMVGMPGMGPDMGPGQFGIPGNQRSPQHQQMMLNGDIREKTPNPIEAVQHTPIPPPQPPSVMEQPPPVDVGYQNQPVKPTDGPSAQSSNGSSSGRAGGYGGFKGRGAQPPQAPARSRAGFRGRGRGSMYEAPATAPVRSTSPLPPNVPTGPRNQRSYKDRDVSGSATDGLDYGGNSRDPYSHHGDEERGGSSSRSRKRRGSPSADEYPSRSKRR